MCLCAFASPAAAQSEWPRFVIRTGALIVDVGSDVRIDATSGQQGTTINLNDDLGFSNTATTFFIDGMWRISHRNRLLVSYERVNRDVSRALVNRTITSRDQTFTVGGEVDAFFDTSYVSADYGFAFVAGPKFELGASIGITVLRLHSGIALTASGASAGASVSRDLTGNTRFTVPVPLPGLFFTVRAHPRFTIFGMVRVIKASITDTTASFVETKAGVDFKISGPLGAGMAYYFNRSIVDREGSSTNGRLEYSFNGPQAFVTFVF
jgi:hypothetical protein